MLSMRGSEAVVLSIAFLSGVRSADVRCYVCTTIDAAALLKELTDHNWLRWLENVRHAPYSKQCEDDFKVELALRNGVRNQDCGQGMCLKMTIQQNDGVSYVWRSCIPRAKKEIREDCTKVSSSEGNLEMCACKGNLCNSSRRTMILFSPVVFILLRLLL